MWKVPLTSIFVALTLLALPFTVQATPCDEQCKRAKAEIKLNIRFPSYLNKRYCKDVRQEFLTSAARSLQRYRDRQLSKLHQGGMHHTRQFLLQRKEWLSECDTYLQHISRYRIFRSANTTHNIFKAIDKVEAILAALVNGATYVDDEGYGAIAAASEHFDHLLALLQQHKTQMQVAGQINID